VLGQTVYHQLFAEGDNAIGAVITVKGIPLRVVGLYASKGQSAMGQDQDDVVMIPFTTGERKILGVAAPTLATTENALYPAISNPYGIAPRLTGFVNAIFVQATDSGNVQKAIDEVMARRSAIDTVARQRQEVERQINTINEEQARIRENMKALPKDSDILRRYLTKFDTQESQIESLRTKVTDLAAQESKLKADLDNYLAELNIE